jgi:hypothetical protein
MATFLGYYRSKVDQTIYRVSEDGPVFCICDILNNLNPETRNALPGDDFRFIGKTFPSHEVELSAS